MYRSMNDTKSDRNYRHLSKKVRGGVSRDRKGKKERPVLDEDYSSDSLVLFTKCSGERGFFSPLDKWTDAMCWESSEEEPSPKKEPSDEEEPPRKPLTKNLPRVKKLLDAEYDLEKKLLDNIEENKKLHIELKEVRYRLVCCRDSDTDSDTDSGTQ